MSEESPCSKKEWLNPKDPSCTAYVMTECGPDPCDEGGFQEFRESVSLELFDGDNAPSQLDLYLEDREDAMTVLAAIAAVRRALDRIEAYVRMWHEAWRFGSYSGIAILDEDSKLVPRDEPLPKSGPTF